MSLEQWSRALVDLEEAKERRKHLINLQLRSRGLCRRISDIEKDPIKMVQISDNANILMELSQQKREANYIRSFITMERVKQKDDLHWKTKVEKEIRDRLPIFRLSHETRREYPPIRRFFRREANKGYVRKHKAKRKMDTGIKKFTAADIDFSEIPSDKDNGLEDRDPLELAVGATNITKEEYIISSDSDVQ